MCGLRLGGPASLHGRVYHKLLAPLGGWVARPACPEGIRRGGIHADYYDYADSGLRFCKICVICVICGSEKLGRLGQALRGPTMTLVDKGDSHENKSGSVD